MQTQVAGSHLELLLAARGNHCIANIRWQLLVRLHRYSQLWHNQGCARFCEEASLDRLKDSSEGIFPLWSPLHFPSSPREADISATSRCPSSKCAPCHRDSSLHCTGNYQKAFGIALGCNVRRGRIVCSVGLTTRNIENSELKILEGNDGELSNMFVMATNDTEELLTRTLESHVCNNQMGLRLSCQER